MTQRRRENKLTQRRDDVETQRNNPGTNQRELIRSKALFKFDSVEFEKAFFSLRLCVIVSLR